MNRHVVSSQFFELEKYCNALKSKLFIKLLCQNMALQPLLNKEQTGLKV